MSARTGPDFIIGGAPKCGTTSLHYMLDQHPEVSLPGPEIHYFDADDPVTHPDFFGVSQGLLRWYDVRPGAPSAQWYADQFAGLPPSRLVGEDSTTYLFSAVAPARIKATFPSMKLLFMVRNPVERAYSQYWHLVSTGRVSVPFEKALTTHPSIVLGSTYAPHLDRYLSLFGPAQVQVEIMEEMVADKQGCVDRVARFLGLDPMDVDDQRSWFNRTHYPSHLGGQLTLNRVSRPIGRLRYRRHMAGTTDLGRRARARDRVYRQWSKRVRPLLLTSPAPPPMAPETRAFLEQHLSARNSGLSAALDRPMGEVWRGFTD